MKVPYPEPVTVVRVTHTLHGDPVSSTETNLPGCAIVPAGVGTEATNFQQDPTSKRLTIVAPPGSDIVATDKVRVRGDLYDVNGPPELLKSPLSGHDFGIQVSLVLTAG